VAAATAEGLSCVAPLAALLAGPQGEVVVLHVDSPGAGDGEEQHSWLRLVRWQRESLHLPVRLVSRHGREPCAAIAEIAREEDVGLVVVTPQRRAERRILLGSVTERLARQAELDILCVPFAAPKERAPAIQRILVHVGVAGAPEPDLAWPVRLAKEQGCSLHVLGVVPIDPWPGPFGLAGTREAARVARQGELVVWTRRRIPEGLPAVVSAVVGDPTTEILGRAHGIGADLIALPAPSTDPDEAFIGSTTERVLRRSRCPVLISAAARKCD
jgi:nucleotide-binding universal stress UspA family protein